MHHTYLECCGNALRAVRTDVGATDIQICYFAVRILQQNTQRKSQLSSSDDKLNIMHAPYLESLSNTCRTRGCDTTARHAKFNHFAVCILRNQIQNVAVIEVRIRIYIRNALTAFSTDRCASRYRSATAPAAMKRSQRRRRRCTIVETGPRLSSCHRETGRQGSRNRPKWREKQSFG